MPTHANLIVTGVNNRMVVTLSCIERERESAMV